MSTYKELVIFIKLIKKQRKGINREPSRNAAQRPTIHPREAGIYAVERYMVLRTCDAAPRVATPNKAAL